MIPNLLGKIFARLWEHNSIQRWAYSRHYGHLVNKRGPYMLRYTIVARGGWGSKVLKALTLGRYDHVRLHHIMQADFDRELHNHPFKYRTFILEGWYKEQRPDCVKTRALLVGDSVTGEGYHRITAVPRDGVTTLFFMGKDSGEWGFLVNGRHVTSREFFNQRKGK